MNIIICWGFNIGGGVKHKLIIYYLVQWQPRTTVVARRASSLVEQTAGWKMWNICPTVMHTPCARYSATLCITSEAAMFHIVYLGGSP